MIKIVRNALANVIDNIDAGNSTLSDEECLKVVDQLAELTNRSEKLSKYQAYKYLNISRATFDNYVKEGKIPKGMKQQGFKELFWYRKDLDKI